MLPQLIIAAAGAPTPSAVKIMRTCVIVNVRTTRHIRNDLDMSNVAPWVEYVDGLVQPTT